MESEEIQKKVKSISFQLFIAIGLLLLTLFIFWAIADKIVLAHENRFDLLIFQKLSFLNSPFTTGLMLFFTFFGSNNFLGPAYVLLTAYLLFFRKNIKLSITVAAIGLISMRLLYLMKNIFKRQRPLDPLIQNVTGYSFPSGHSFSAFTFFGLLIYLLWKSEIKKKWKYLLSIALILFAACIAFSRVYFHVHYASDVIGGFCLSMLWLNVSLWLLSKINFGFRQDK